MGSLGTSIMEDLDTHPRTDALLRTTPSIAKSHNAIDACFSREFMVFITNEENSVISRKQHKHLSIRKPAHAQPLP